MMTYLERRYYDVKIIYCAPEDTLRSSRSFLV